MTKKFVKICPQCNSKDVSNDFSNFALARTGLKEQKCNHCGFTGQFFPEVEISKIPPIKKLKEVGKREIVNTRHGRRILWLWKYTGPLGILISLILIFQFKIKYLFYMGLLVALPTSLVVTLAAHKSELFKKYKFLRILSIIVLIICYILSVFVLGMFFPSS